MTIIEDRVVRRVCSFDLIERLRNKETLEPIARHEGERRLKEIKPSPPGTIFSMSTIDAVGPFRSSSVYTTIWLNHRTMAWCSDFGRRYNEISVSADFFNEI